MSYVIYNNTGNSNNYSANPNNPIPSNQVIGSTGSWGGGGGKKKGGEFELEVGGQTFDDFTEGTGQNTYTFVDGTTAVSNGDTVEIKYDKDDDGSNQDIDVVSVDLSGFDANITMDLKSAQTADRLYLSNVLSFTVNGNTTEGSTADPDNNGNLFGEQTFRIQEAKSNAASVTYLDANGVTRTMEITLGGGGATNMQVMVDFICFARGTLIETEHGPKAIEDLSPGDMVKTKDSGLQVIEWISSRKLSAQELQRMPHLRPIRFRKGALGQNLPSMDLVVSPQHRMLLNDWRCQMLFDAREVLAPSKALVNDRDIMTDHDADGVEYFHFMCKEHEIVYANGTESESFHPGEFGTSTLDDDAREELFTVFPQLRGGMSTYGQTARPVLKAFEVSLLNEEA
jgi:hypothetical protein